MVDLAPCTESKICLAGRLHAAKSGFGLCDAMKAHSAIEDVAQELLRVKDQLAKMPKKSAMKGGTSRAGAGGAKQHKKRVEFSQARSADTRSERLRHVVPGLLNVRDGVCVDIVQKKVADAKRKVDQVGHEMELKAKASHSWKAIDVYRAAFLIKHCSRGKMNAHSKKMLAYLCAHVRCAGSHWAEDDEEADEMRAVAIAVLKDEAEASERRADKEYQQFTKRWFAAQGDDGDRCNPKEMMLRCSQAWNASEANPKNQAHDDPIAGSIAWRAAAKKAAVAALRAAHEERARGLLPRAARWKA